MIGLVGAGRGTALAAATHPSRLLVVLLTAQLALGPAAWAQVVRDGSIGPGGGGLVQGGTDDLGQPATYLIEDDLGEQVGGNLFHSFSQFDVQATETATFTSASSTPIDTILSRVTGPSPAHIYGRLRSTIPGAGLFLLSPSGIVVGRGR